MYKGIFLSILFVSAFSAVAAPLKYQIQQRVEKRMENSSCTLEQVVQQVKTGTLMYTCLESAVRQVEKMKPAQRAKLSYTPQDHKQVLTYVMTPHANLPGESGKLADYLSWLLGWGEANTCYKSQNGKLIKGDCCDGYSALQLVQTGKHMQRTPCVERVFYYFSAHPEELTENIPSLLERHHHRWTSYLDEWNRQRPDETKKMRWGIKHLNQVYNQLLALAHGETPTGTLAGSGVGDGAGTGSRFEQQEEVLPGWTRAEVAKSVYGKKSSQQQQALFNKIQDAARRGADLKPFIEFLINKGSASPDAPNYVSAALLNVSFMIYAKSVPDSRTIFKYTSSGYSTRVNFAAANALAEFARTRQKEDGSLELNQPAGHFELSAQQRQGLLRIFALTVAGKAQKDPKSPVYLSLLYKVGRLYENPEDKLSQAVAVNRPNKIGLEEASAAVVLALPKEAVAATSLSTMASATVAVGGVVLVYIAVNEALAPALKNAFLDELSVVLPEDLQEDERWEIFPREALNDDAYSLSYTEPEVWDGSMARFGEYVGAQAASKTRKKRLTCTYKYTLNEKYWRLDRLGEYANPGNIYTKQRLLQIRECLSRTPLCPREVLPSVKDAKISTLFKNCRQQRIRNIQLTNECAKDFKELQEVEQVARSFYGPNGNRLFTRTIYWMTGNGQWRWIPEAEIGIRGADDLSRMFVQSIWEQIFNIGSRKLRSTIGNGDIQFGNGSSFRNGGHEQTKNKKNEQNPFHFHWQELQYYDAKKTKMYLCNHSIEYSLNKLPQ